MDKFGHVDKFAQVWIQLGKSEGHCMHPFLIFFMLFFLLALLASSFSGFLLTFIDFGTKMVSKMDYFFLRVWLRIAPCSDKDPKSVHNGFQEGSKDQK